MDEINNLIYSIEISYVNDSNLNVSICRKMDDKGLEMNSTRVGEVCISEETINGRVLSGRYDDQNVYCGYKYNYEKTDDEYLVNINKKVLLNNAINLINKTKMESEFLSAKMVLASIIRNDYRVFSIQKGQLIITKTVTAENVNKETFFVQKRTFLSKSEGDLDFKEIKQTITCKTDDACINLHQTDLANDVSTTLNTLSKIINQNPNNCKELIDLKSSFQTTLTI